MMYQNRALPASREEAGNALYFFLKRKYNLYWPEQFLTLSYMRI